MEEEESKVDASQSHEVSHEDAIPALELVWQTDYVQ